MLIVDKAFITVNTYDLWKPLDINHGDHWIRRHHLYNYSKKFRFLKVLHNAYVAMFMEIGLLDIWKNEITG